MHPFETNEEMTGEMIRGKVARLSRVSPMSGITTLHFQDGKTVFVESGSGVRALARMYGGLQNLIGKEIVVVADFLNVMRGVADAEEYDNVC